MTKYLLIALAVLTVTAGMLAMHFRGAAAISAAGRVAAEQRADGLAADLKQSEAARTHEHAEALRFQGIADQYEQDKLHAQADASRLAADLRAERVRLRPVWRCPATGVPEAWAGAGKRDEGAADRSESASRVVRAAAEADAQIRALQAILTAERQP
jgi:hypothetical protein